MKIARVALDVPLDETFDFRVPEGVEVAASEPRRRAFRTHAARSASWSGQRRPQRGPGGAAAGDRSASSRTCRRFGPAELELFEFCAALLPAAPGRGDRREPAAAAAPGAPARRSRPRRAGRATPAIRPRRRAHAASSARRSALHRGRRRPIPPGAAPGRHRQRQDRGLPAPHRRRRSRAAARRSSSCPRSASRRSSRRRCARAFPARAVVAAHSHLARGRARRGLARGAVGRRAASCSERASPCSCRSATSASSSSTRSTTRRTSSRRGCATRRATSRCGARSASAFRSCSARPRPRSESIANARDGPLRARRASTRARAAGAAHAGRAHRRHARRPPARRAHPRPASGRSRKRLARGEQVARVREPARLLAGALLPRVRVALDLRALQREPGAAPRDRRAALPPLRPCASAFPPRCPQLRRRRTSRPIGHGTQRVEEALRARFPEARIARVDRDSTARKGALARASSSACARARSTSSSARRCSPRATTIPTLTLVGRARRRQRALQRRLPRRRAPLRAARAGVGPRGPRRSRRARC